VRLDKLAPDLAMVNLGGHKLKIQDLQKEETPIGEGGSILPFIFWIGSLLEKTNPTPSLPVFACNRRLCYCVQRHLAWPASGNQGIETGCIALI